jgi:hypothetical protein
MIDHQTVNSWMEELRSAWEGRDVPRALALFVHTAAYYERPFKPGTTQDEIHDYWKDIVGLEDIRLDYEIVAVEGDSACVQWDNWFKEAAGSPEQHLNGIFVIRFDPDGNCREFRQWWFAES